MYKKKTGRFVSEYGMQALPDMRTLETFCSREELELSSVSLKAHQKHATGFETLDHYMEMYYGKTTELRRYVYLSQLLQRDALKIAIEHHRISQPRCMGTMFWQINDCWPGISWSVTDHHQNKKAAALALKDLYAQVKPVIEEKDSTFHFWVVNDSMKNFGGEYLIRIKDFEGKLLLERKIKIYLHGGKATMDFGLEKHWLKDMNLAGCYMIFKYHSGKLYRETKHYFVLAKQLKLPGAKLEISYDAAKNSIKVVAGSFVKDLYLYCENEEVNFDQNFFDLEKGDAKEIRLSAGKLKDVDEVKWMSLNK